MLYADAKKMGYKNVKTSWQRGYVSRRINIDNQPVLTSARGLMYVLLPSWQSTQYCIRQYLAK